MTTEWQNKTENSVEEQGRSSAVANGSFKLTPDNRVRQPLMAKEPLCGNQSTNLSLVIAVLRFPSCFVILLCKQFVYKEAPLKNNY